MILGRYLHYSAQLYATNYQRQEKCDLCEHAKSCGVLASAQFTRFKLYGSLNALWIPSIVFQMPDVYITPEYRSGPYI